MVNPRCISVTSLRPSVFRFFCEGDHHETPVPNQSSGGSTHPRLSADGRYLTFASEASNLVPGDTNEISDIFRYDTMTGARLRVSLKNE